MHDLTPDELQSGALVELCPVPKLAETSYAIVQKRRFPNRLLGEIISATPRLPKLEAAPKGGSLGTRQAAQAPPRQR